MERYSSEEIRQLIAQGASLTDWEAVRAQSDDEVERLADADDAALGIDAAALGPPVYVTGASAHTSMGAMRTVQGERVVTPVASADYLSLAGPVRGRVSRIVHVFGQVVIDVTGDGAAHSDRLRTAF